MLEGDLMENIDLVEQAAKHVGLTTRRYEVRSLIVVQVLEPNGEWSLFDPVRQGKDVAKMLYALSKKTGAAINENQFRTKLLKEVAEYDFTISQER